MKIKFEMDYDDCGSFEALITESLLRYAFCEIKKVGGISESGNVVVRWTKQNRLIIYARIPNTKVLTVFANIRTAEERITFEIPMFGPDLNALLAFRKSSGRVPRKMVVSYDLNQESKMQIAFDYVVDFIKRLAESANYEENQHTIA